MFTLSADNRPLTKNAKFSYLSTNYLSGVSSLVLVNSNGFADSDYILLGEFGSETSEIVQITSVTTATHTIGLTSSTKFAHSESTKVCILKYNQVRFYHTDTATFSSNPVNELTGSPVNIQADSRYTILYDTTNTTGFGWFVFYNSTTLTASQSSNAIPYAGFDENSVRNIIDNFYSLLNNKEIKLISTTDTLRWLNEAYAIAINELNLSNSDFTVTAATDVSVVSGTQEYAFASNFSKLISVYDQTNDIYLNKVDSSLVDNIDDIANASDLSYYIRHSSGTFYIGFTPVPTDSATIKVRYKTKSTKVTSLYDSIYLPDNNYYCLVDYMLYRASAKLGREDGENNRLQFLEGIKRMKLTSFKQDSALDNWSINDSYCI